jgi:hypothetical protein
MCRWRAIIEDMTQMRVAPGALHFRPPHAVAGVGLHLDVFILRRIPEARPAGAGLKLLLRMKKVSAATNAAEHSVLMDVPILAGESALGAAVPRHLVLLRREDRLPFRIRFYDFFYAQPALLSEQKLSRTGWAGPAQGRPE